MIHDEVKILIESKCTTKLSFQEKNIRIVDVNDSTKYYSKTLVTKIDQT